MTVIGGHQRLKVLEELGYEEVECNIVDLDKTKEKALNIALNKISGEWDDTKLEELLAELKEVDVDLEMTGFSFDEVDDILKDITGSKEDDFDLEQALEEIDKPVTQLGDIYILGKHRLMCGDSTSEEDVAKLMNGVKADMVFTDPPYGINAVQGNKIGGDKSFGKVGGGNIVKSNTYSTIIGDDTTDTAKKFFNNCVELNIDKFILWGGNYFIDFLPFSSSWLIWDKRVDMNSNDFADGEMAWCSFKTPVRIYHQLWNGMIREGQHEDRVHPTQKPVGMIINILKDFCEENNSILDCFGGSGSTLIACEQLNRKCYMMELDPKYCDVIIKRWETLTGKKAIIRR